jgi:hypothetical protein
VLTWLSPVLEARRCVALPLFKFVRHAEVASTSIEAKNLGLATEFRRAEPAARL